MEVTKISPTEYNFVFANANHTIGNLLQKELLKDSNVTFSGYNKLHPLETKMTLLLITSGKNPREVMANTFSNIITKLDELSILV